MRVFQRQFKMEVDVIPGSQLLFWTLILEQRHESPATRSQRKLRRKVPVRTYKVCVPLTVIFVFIFHLLFLCFFIHTFICFYKEEEKTKTLYIKPRYFVLVTSILEIVKNHWKRMKLWNRFAESEAGCVLYSVSQYSWAYSNDYYSWVLKYSCYELNLNF